MIFDALEALGRIGIEPSGVGGGLLANGNGVVASLAFEFAESGSGRPAQVFHFYVFRRDVVDRWVAGLQHPFGPGGLSDDNTVEDDLNVPAAFLQPRRPGIVPHRFLTGSGFNTSSAHYLYLFVFVLVLSLSKAKLNLILK